MDLALLLAMKIRVKIIVSNTPYTNSELLKGQQLPTLAIGPTQNQSENVKFPKTAFGKRIRDFQSVWFEEFPWMHYLGDTDVVLCHTCARADERKLLSSVFLSEGF